MSPTRPNPSIRRGSSAGAIGRMLGVGENPLWWSIPVGSAGGAQVRLHAAIPLWVTVEIILTLSRTHHGMLHIGPALGWLLGICILRECVRLWAWRRALRRLDAAGAIDAVVIWPLGLLAVASHGPVERKAGVAAAAALGVNLVLMAVLTAALFWLNQPAIYFDILDPYLVITKLGDPLTIVVWWGYYANLIVLLANLIPALPMDGGRVIDATLASNAPATGVSRRRLLFLRSGIALMSMLFILGAILDLSRIIALAVFGGVACWVALGQLKFWNAPLLREPQAHETVPDEIDEPAASPTPAPRGPKSPDPAEVDHVLALLSKVGIAGLTDDQRKLLESATEHLRRTL